MTKYHVKCLPNWNEYETDVEADSVEEAIAIAEEEAYQNCSFSATPDDVEEIEE